MILIPILGIYAPSLWHPFVSYDDPEVLLNNPAVKNFDLWTIFFGTVATDYIPLSLISFSIEHLFFGLNPLPYHITNLALHVANSFLVFKLADKWFSEDKIKALTVALLFSLHPMATEPVAWITGRKDLLFSFFYLLGLLAYFNSDRRPSPLVILTFLFSAFSKSAAASFPLALLAIDWSQKGKLETKDFLSKIPLFFISIVLVITQIFIHKSGTIISEQTIFQRISDPLWGVVFYLSKLLLPYNQSVIYDQGLDWAYPRLGITVFFLFCVFIFERRKSRSIKTYGALLLFLTPLLPVLQFIPYQKFFVFADRYVYLASLGFFLVLVEMAFSIFSQWRSVFGGFGAMIGLSGLTVVFALLSFQRLYAWGSEESLWASTLKSFPNSPVALHNMGVLQYRAGKVSDALSLFERSINSNPQFEVGYNSLGIHYLNSGDLVRAEELFQKSIDVQKNQSIPFFGMAQIARKKQDFPKTESFLSDLQSRYPLNPLPYFEMGLAKYDQNLWDEGIKQFTKSAQLDPANASESFSYMGIGFAKLGDARSARTFIERALALNPNNALARENLKRLLEPQ